MSISPLPTTRSSATATAAIEPRLNFGDFIAYATAKLEDGHQARVMDDREHHLYRTILGPAWDQLAGPVKQSHTAPLYAAGSLDVETPRPFLSRILGLPKAGRNVPSTLELIAQTDRITWARTFGDRRIETYHQLRNGGLVEVSPLGQIQFELTVEDGALHYRSIRTRPWSPIQFRAIVKPTSAGFLVHVEARAPIIGLICRYGGEMRCIQRSGS